MSDPGQVESLWRARLRWRMRGAWQWPAFFALTLADAVLMLELPPFEGGPTGLLGALLLAGFANLFLVAVLAPLAGRILRRRRRDLPRPVAINYAGTMLLCLLAAIFLAAGLFQRPAVAAREADRLAQLAAVHDYVLAQAPEYRSGLSGIDTMQIEDELFRTCVPGPDPRRWLCLYVETDQSPPGVSLDADQAPNSSYRAAGGFR